MYRTLGVAEHGLGVFAGKGPATGLMTSTVVSACLLACVCCVSPSRRSGCQQEDWRRAWDNAVHAVSQGSD